MANRTGVTELDGAVTTWTYDRTYQLLGEDRDGPVSFRATYTYDDAGNRTGRTEPVTGAATYDWDEESRLTEVALKSEKQLQEAFEQEARLATSVAEKQAEVTALRGTIGKLQGELDEITKLDSATRQLDGAIERIDRNVDRWNDLRPKFAAGEASGAAFGRIVQKDLLDPKNAMSRELGEEYRKSLSKSRQEARDAVTRCQQPQGTTADAIEFQVADELIVRASRNVRDACFEPRLFSEHRNPPRQR